MSTNMQTHSSLFSVPVEIRLMIYEWLPLTTKHHTIKHPSNASIYDKPVSFAGELTLIMRSIPVSILSTCRLIYFEAFSILRRKIDQLRCLSPRIIMSADGFGPRSHLIGCLFYKVVLMGLATELKVLAGELSQAQAEQEISQQRTITRECMGHIGRDAAIEFRKIRDFIGRSVVQIIHGSRTNQGDRTSILSDTKYVEVAVTSNERIRWSNALHNPLTRSIYCTSIPARRVNYGVKFRPLLIQETGLKGRSILNTRRWLPQTVVCRKFRAFQVRKLINTDHWPREKLVSEAEWSYGWAECEEV